MAEAIFGENGNIGENGGGANGGGNIFFSADLYRINKVVFLQKEYEEELRAGETAATHRFALRLQ